MVYWITGKKNSGKTTLAKKIHGTLLCAFRQPCCVLDGDEVRGILGDLQYTDDGRMENIRRIVGIAKILHLSGIVPIIALVSPSYDLRNVGRLAFPDMRLIYVEGGELWPGTTYEEPRSPWWKYDWSFPDDQIAEKLGLL